MTLSYLDYSLTIDMVPYCLLTYPGHVPDYIKYTFTYCSFKGLQTCHMQSPDDQLLEVSSHSLTSAGGRSWVLPVPRLGAGLWQSAASWYPIGGSKRHHDVSQKYIFFFLSSISWNGIEFLMSLSTSAKAHSRTSTCFVKTRFRCFSCGERKRCTVSLLPHNAGVCRYFWPAVWHTRKVFAENISG